MNKRTRPAADQEAQVVTVGHINPVPTRLSGKPLAYELWGLRPNGEVYTVEVLGERSETEAAELAQHYADLWQATVNLNLVPRFRIASAMWRDDEMVLVKQFVPTRTADQA